MNIPRYDCHLHTHFSPCGDEEMVVENIVKKAHQLNIKGLCFTDHLHNNTALTQYSLLRQEIANTDVANLNIWVGCEVNVRGTNSWSIKPEWVDYFEIIIASPIHWIDEVPKPKDWKFKTIVEYVIKMFKGAVNCPGVNIIGHPILLSGLEDNQINTLEVLEKVLKDDRIIEIFKQAYKQNTAMELNPKTINEDNIKLAKRFYQQALECGCKISLCSDAHKLEAMDVWDKIEELINEFEIDPSRDLWLPSKELTYTKERY